MKSMFKEHDVLVTIIDQYRVFEVRINEIGKRVVDFYSNGKLRSTLMSDEIGYCRFFTADGSPSTSISLSTKSLKIAMSLL